jgi:hypothetical protein
VAVSGGPPRFDLCRRVEYFNIEVARFSPHSVKARGMNKEEKEEVVASVPFWLHTIDLGVGKEF